jgi:hypothetical protein
MKRKRTASRASSDNDCIIDSRHNGFEADQPIPTEVPNQGARGCYAILSSRWK